MNNISLDVCVVISSETNGDWVAQCLSSIDIASKKANYTVNLHTTPGIAGNIGQARNNVVLLGTAPYVTFIDDDDYVLPNAFSILEPIFSNNPVAIYTAEDVLNIDGSVTYGGVGHHMAVYSRDFLIDYTLWPCFENLAQNNAIKGFPTTTIKDAVYVYRKYNSKARKLQNLNKKLLNIINTAKIKSLS
jgi:glycosyltransferase involved in cell wall biosynthesis